ncbi:MAG: HAMP domain-containing protein, partial [Clostridium sp.]
MSKRFRARMVTNVIYSAIITCLIEVFLITNVSMIVDYLRETRYEDLFILQLTEMNTLMTLIYVLVGMAIFSFVFFMLQEKSLRYIAKISSAIQNISEGDLNTTVEVLGDDEFTAMAVNLNKMAGDIRRLMDKE